ncbi:hypothetical protein KJ849_02865 [bacterium]|nr:hypothetical protein [bacterium]
MSSKNKEENKVTTSSQLYKNIKAILTESRTRAIGAVNFIMVEAYWNVGKLIVEGEQRGEKRAGYGDYLLKDISKRLTSDLGSGFSEQSLRILIICGNPDFHQDRFCVPLTDRIMEKRR